MDKFCHLSENLHLSLGFHITQPNDPLTKINFFQLHALITNKDDLCQKTMALRQLYLLNKESYNQNKKKLPYISGSVFHPPYRRTENFGYTRLLIMDIDHLSVHGKSVHEVKNQLLNDPRVAFLFTSPSGDGLKVFFILKERCSSPVLYRQFYRYFVQHFGRQYQIPASVDKNTCDVTRACFLCHDPDVFLKVEKVECLEMQVPSDFKMEEENPVNDSGNPALTNDGKNNPSGPSDEILEQIRKNLNPSAYHKKEKRQEQVYITGELKRLEPFLREKLNNISQINEIQIRPISYALQIQVAINNLRGEINLFHGKRGFTIVPSTRSSVDIRATQLLKEIVQHTLNEYGNQNVE